MNSLKFTSRLIGIFTISVFILFSCKKDQNPTDGGNGGNLPSCSENSGYFTLNLDGENFELVVDEETQFTNLYGWFEEDQSDFIIYGKDQNADYLQVELGLPGKFLVGSTTYSIDSLDNDFFTFNVGGNSKLYVSNVTFNVSTSNLIVSDGIYKPMKATYSGLAHSYPWINGQAPADTFNISGSICLNGIILP